MVQLAVCLKLRRKEQIDFDKNIVKFQRKYYEVLKPFANMPILWLLNILLAMLHFLRQQLSYWAHTNDQFIIGGD